MSRRGAAARGTRTGHDDDPVTEAELRVKDPDARGTNTDVLRVPAFRRLCMVWVFSNFGDSALFLTAAIWVKQLTGSDAAAGLVFVALGLPALLAPLTGQLADRFPRRRVLVLNNLCAAVVVLALLTVRTADQLWLVYMVIFLYGTTAYVTAAAQSGLLRDLFADRLLPPANGLLSSIDQGLRIVSPLVGAALLALAGMRSVVLLTAACFMVAALVLLTLHVSEMPRAGRGAESFWQSTTAGFRFLAGHRLLSRAMITLGVAVGATGIFNVTIFATVEQGLGMPPEFLSVLVGTQGVLSVVGGVTAATVMARIGLRRSILLSVALLAVAVLAAAVPSLPVVLTGAGLMGGGVSWLIVAFVTLRQQETPASLQGRTSAAASMLINVPQVVANTIAAALIGVVDFRVLILVTGVLCLAGALPLLRYRAERLVPARDMRA
ncbi:hypothetical protein AC792_13055 [Arthrobacter sp. RIT-PI-e]|uniref:MFS transporter n=1 Tax=Arthrobacter sp. RIT-PI-e TaxID=1681197 RepID=UPI00067625A9|nr:MFS transporter [Arthrobacter sp. RIT-PI-e]KNC17777.1 hypothetical protein AC792_13055 [Arthrobacter sp. RIT-PI-e]